MRRSTGNTPRFSCHTPTNSRCGYTLVEILTATVLMLIIMMAVTVIFANVTDSIGQSRATLEMSQRLRATAAILKQDLENVTAVMNPPLHPRANQGYFQYVEGPIGPILYPSDVALNTDREGQVDAAGIPLDMETTVGDVDDIIMFTAMTEGEPYVGLINGSPQTSNTAEIIWFIRGRTLYRRVLLVKPELDVRSVAPYGFYSGYDLSVHKTWDDTTVTTSGGVVQHRPVLKANSLADLTNPSNRFAHHPDPRAYTAPNPSTGSVTSKGVSVRYYQEGKVFPHYLRPWLGAPHPVSGRWVPGLGLPILAESSTVYSEVPPGTPTWIAGDAVPSEPAAWGVAGYGYNPDNESVIQMPFLANAPEPIDAYDPWTNGREHPWSNVDPITGAIADFSQYATRIGDDVIMTNVIGFDVKAWDPNAPVLSIPSDNPPGSGTTNPIRPEVVLRPGDPAYIARLRMLQERIGLASPPYADSTYMPSLGAYVDLNYMAKIPMISGYYPDNVAVNLTGTLPVPVFGRQGNAASLAYGAQWGYAIGEEPYPPSYVYTRQPYEYFPAIYDTWSLDYEYNHHIVDFVCDNPGNANRSSLPVGNENRNGLFDEGTDGFDNNGINGVDDIAERETQPPYAAPLRGIQIRIRAFEPASRQVREVTIIQKFRTK